MELSRWTVRRILRAAGVPSPRRRRPAKHRSRRERYPMEGMLPQVDGSRRPWLEARGPWLTLVGAVDDATGTVPWALFREQQDARGYRELLRGILQHKGIPEALHADRHSIFTVSRPETLEEQLTGQRTPTQVGQALVALGIQLVLAFSPQAKGRIERLWQTLQDRLVLEPRLAGAGTLEDANPPRRAVPAQVQCPVRRGPTPWWDRLSVRAARPGPGRGPLLPLSADRGRGQHGDLRGAGHPGPAGPAPGQLCAGPGRGSGTAGWTSRRGLSGTHPSEHLGASPAGNAAGTQGHTAASGRWPRDRGPG